MATDTSKITSAADELSAGLAKGGTAAKTLGVEIAAAIKSLDGRVAALEAGGSNPVPPDPQPPSTAMADTVKQNTKGQSEAFPTGVPHDWGFYSGKYGTVGGKPPANFTAATGWGQIYQEEGQPLVAGKIQLSHYESWMRLTNGTWVKIQDQATGGLGGAYYVNDFANNQNKPWTAKVLPDGTVEIDAPPAGFCAHYWPQPRGTYAAGTVDGAFMICTYKVAAANMRFVVMNGGDWWLDKNAGWNGVDVNNPPIGGNNWIKLGTTARTSYFTSLSEQDLKANPPPPLR
jgi:hypothetical protein